MEISLDARAVVDALIDEGYAWLAGELLEEFAKGMRPDVTAGDSEDFETEPDHGPVFRKEPLPAQPLRIVSTLEAAQDRPAEPIPLDKQAAFASAYLRLRLVEPFRRLAEAERIANRLVALQTDLEQDPDGEVTDPPAIDAPVRFALVDGTPAERRRDDAGASAADDLASALDAIAETGPRLDREL